MQAVLLHRQGASKRAISRALKCGRNTVTRLLTGHDEHASDFLPVRITSTQVFIYSHDLRCIATHDRLQKGQLGRGRAPATPRGEGFDELGQEAVDFLPGLERAFPRYTAHHARKVLALRERYKTSDRVAAIKHALRFGAVDSAAVARIVESQASPRTLDEYACRTGSASAARGPAPCANMVTSPASKRPRSRE